MLAVAKAKNQERLGRGNARPASLFGPRVDMRENEARRLLIQLKNTSCSACAVSLPAFGSLSLPLSFTFRVVAIEDVLDFRRKFIPSESVKCGSNVQNPLPAVLTLPSSTPICPGKDNSNEVEKVFRFGLGLAVCVLGGGTIAHAQITRLQLRPAQAPMSMPTRTVVQTAPAPMQDLSAVTMLSTTAPINHRQRSSRPTIICLSSQVPLPQAAPRPEGAEVRPHAVDRCAYPPEPIQKRLRPEA